MLLRIKKLEDKQNSELNRSLNTLDLIGLGIGAIVGTGIFTITGLGAKNWAGPALSISFVLAAISIMFSGLIFAEYSSKISAIGGPYAYMYRVFGEFIGWISGWLIIVEFILAGASVASGWSGYLQGFLSNIGIQLPKALSASYNPSDGTYINLIAMLVLLLVAAFVSFDAKKALSFNLWIVILKIFVVILFIVVGVFYMKPENLHPFMPYGFIGVQDGKGVVAGAAFVFFAYLGFETIAMAVDEVKNPQKAIPRSILGSIALVTILYVLVIIVLCGIVPFQKLGVPDPLAFAMRLVHQPIVASIISAVVIVSLLTVLISMTYALSRLIYGISKDGLLPKFLSKVYTKHKTPKLAVYFGSGIAAIFAGFIPLDTLAEVVNMVTLLYLIIMACGIFGLRKLKINKTKDTFEAPFGFVVPVLSILISFALMLNLSAKTWLGLAFVLTIGTLIYFVYGYKNSKYDETQKKAMNQ